MSKIIVYDFDKTLTNNDTLLGFLTFNSKKNLLYFLKLFIYFMSMVLTKFKLISNDNLKNIGVILFIKNLTNNELQFKYNNYFKYIDFNFLFKETNFSELDNTYIISASFEEYLKPIFPVNIKVIGSRIDKNRSKLEFNCYGKNKIIALKSENINHIDIFYTDSISDLPLVKIAKKTILIKNNLTIECNSIEDFLRNVK